MTHFFESTSDHIVSISTREDLVLYENNRAYHAAIFLKLFNPMTDAWLGVIGATEKGKGVGSMVLKDHERKLIEAECLGICGVFAPDDGHYDDLYRFYVERNEYEFYNIAYSDFNNLPGVPDELKRYKMGYYTFVYKRFK